MEQINNSHHEAANNANEQVKTTKNKKLMLAVLAAAVAIAMIITAFLIIKWNGPQCVAIRYLKGGLGETSRREAFNLSPGGKNEFLRYRYGCKNDNELLEQLNKEFGEKFLSLNDYYKCIDKRIRKDIEDRFGAYAVSMKAIDIKDTSIKSLQLKRLYGVDRLRLRIEELLDGLNIDEEEITACKEVNIEFVVTGEKETYRGNIHVYVAKIKGAWKGMVLGHNNALE